MRGTTTPTEWSTLQADFSHWFKSLIETQDSPFAGFTTDEILPSGKRADGLLTTKDGSGFYALELRRHNGASGLSEICTPSATRL